MLDGSFRKEAAVSLAPLGCLLRWLASRPHAQCCLHAPGTHSYTHMASTLACPWVSSQRLPATTPLFHSCMPTGALFQGPGSHSFMPMGATPSCPWNPLLYAPDSQACAKLDQDLFRMLTGFACALASEGLKDLLRGRGHPWVQWDRGDNVLVVGGRVGLSLRVVMYMNEIAPCETIPPPTR